jgi:hypothetical protein
MRQKPAREADEFMKIQQIPHIATTGGHNYAGREQDPHRYYKTLQNPTKIKKNTKYIMTVMLLVMVSLL